MTEEQPKKGEPDKDGYIVKLETMILPEAGGECNDIPFVTLPDKLIKDMDWQVDDEIEVSTIENCFDWGDVSSIVLRNLTKERKD